ncbi:ROK family transcriptional regulator [Brachybacterium sp. YJGR34]|uniref:ROK family transcriptional regulator n=1 Tax=Brachybacterium sp. YJGR34 TaxID=2059911 RepID=UPI000E0B45A8|nr:ROK family transcriptional regulator [Brachybacterium sp. YJGR34]
MQSTHLREHNLSAILRALATSSAPTSRAGLAKLTGLTKPTVSKLVEELIDAELVQEGTPLSGGTGRPMVPLQPAEGTLLAIGLEIAADRLSCLGTDLAGREIARREVRADVAAQRPAEVVAQCAELVAALRAQVPRLPLTGVVAAVPGRISPGDGRVLSAPNLGWVDVPFLRALAEREELAGVGVRAQNDNRLSVLTEIDHRPGESFVYVRGSTGVGGAVVLGGTLLDGLHGWAGEFGHTVVAPGGALCRCGRRGCLEAYISAHALRSQAGLGPEVPLEGLVDALARSASRTEVIGTIGRSLGIAIANALNVLDLSTVVLSGYLSPIAEEIAPVVRETVEAHALAADIGPIAIERSDGLADPALHGAARAALQPVFEDPGAWIPRLR